MQYFHLLIAVLMVAKQENWLLENQIVIYRLYLHRAPTGSVTAGNVVGVVVGGAVDHVAKVLLGVIGGISVVIRIPCAHPGSHTIPFGLHVHV